MGGFATKNPNNDDGGQIKALKTAIQRGLNYIETNMWAAEGHGAWILSEAIKGSGVSRDDLFIVFVGYPYNVGTIFELESLLDKFLKLLNSDYVDSFQSSMSTYSKFGEDKTNGFVKKILQSGKARFTSFTNGNLETIEKYKKVFEDRLIAHEVCFNFEIRLNEDMGITDFAKKWGILNVVYQPLRRNRTALQNWPLLVNLAKKYNKAQNQIILNWIIRKGFLPLVKTDNLDHLEENLKSLEFEIDQKDFSDIDSFRIGSDLPKIDWSRSGNGKIDGDGIYVDQLPNIIDELISTI